MKSEENQWSHHLHTHSLSQPPTVILLQRLDGQITATREKSESEAKAQLQTLSQELKSDVAQLHTRVEGTAQEVRTCVSISLSLSLEVRPIVLLHPTHFLPFSLLHRPRLRTQRCSHRCNRTRPARSAVWRHRCKPFVSRYVYIEQNRRRKKGNRTQTHTPTHSHALLHTPTHTLTRTYTCTHAGVQLQRVKERQKEQVQTLDLLADALDEKEARLSERIESVVKSVVIV